MVENPIPGSVYWTNVWNENRAEGGPWQGKLVEEYNNLYIHEFSAKTGQVHKMSFGHCDQEDLFETENEANKAYLSGIDENIQDLTEEIDELRQIKDTFKKEKNL